MEAEMEGWMWQRDGREWRSWYMNEKKKTTCQKKFMGKSIMQPFIK
jgi:hypothetical protein